MNTDLLSGGRSRSVSAALLAGRTWMGPSILNPILRQHTRVLARMLLHDCGVARSLVPGLKQIVPLVEQKTTLLTTVKRTTLNTIPVLVRLAAHRKSWIRKPEDWEPDLQLAPRELLKSLIEFLLVRYPVPPFAMRCWFIDGALHHIERDWFCHISQGGNIRAFSGWIPKLTRQSAHLFQEAPDSFSMREAIRYAQVFAVWQDESIACAIARSRIGTDFRNDKIWLPLFEKWAFSEFGMDEFFAVADYLWARCELEGSDTLRMKSRSAESLLRSSLRWFADIRNDTFHEKLSIDSLPDWFLDSEVRMSLLRRQADRWNPLEGVEAFETQKFGWRWKMVELTDQRSLYIEGEDMSHCVGLYSGECQRGESSIFSLRSCKLNEGELDREVTLEVDRKSRRVVQVRAWRNRIPLPAARKVILEWCRANSLEPGAWTRW